mmetsp:Transcript_17629/g.55251  ORF Transcript_17629/g.55251 Transcript_17629/m.55251 type:complete len:80 (+) Transcript_17629:1459-1698(+)
MPESVHTSSGPAVALHAGQTTRPRSTHASQTQTGSDRRHGQRRDFLVLPLLQTKHCSVPMDADVEEVAPEDMPQKDGDR